MSPFGASSRTRCGRDIVPHDFAIDMLLAHPAGDQLGVLRAEIEHQHLFVGDAGDAFFGLANGDTHRFFRGNCKRKTPEEFSPGGKADYTVCNHVRLAARYRSLIITALMAGSQCHHNRQ